MTSSTLALDTAFDAFLELCPIPYVEGVDPRKALAAAIEAYLAALPQGETVTVPREPTDEMMVAYSHNANPRNLQLSKAGYAAMLAAAPASPSGLDARTVEAAVVAGWNACRKSLYAVCEDIQEQADALRISAPVTTAAAEQHSKGYHAGSNFAAKSIARGFNSMEAMDDDNALAALRSLTQETTK